MNEHNDCGSPCDCKSKLPRRDFIRLMGVGGASLLGAGANTLQAEPAAAPADFAKLVPPDKHLDPAWVKSLYARGVPTVYRGEAELKYIGMPVGGITCGQLYLGGDGQLWHWDIFNQHWGTGDHNYAHPPAPASQIEQGFSLRVDAPGAKNWPLDKTGFSDISFTGQYPIGTVQYADPACPLVVTLEAFSPFIPLDVENSSLPATALRFTVKNTSSEAVEATLIGRLENAVCIEHRDLAGVYRNRLAPGTGMSFLQCSAEPDTNVPQPGEPDVVFEDWDKDNYDGWKVEGEAFGSGPVKRSALPAYIGDVGGQGAKVVNSHASAPGATPGEKDAKTGKLTSAPFLVTHKYIELWVGGGSHVGATCVNLLVDGKAVQSVTGENKNPLVPRHFDLRQLQGRQARLEIVDESKGSWGNIGVGRITFSNQPRPPAHFEQLEDYGTFGLALLGAAPDHFFASADKDGLTGKEGQEATAPLAEKIIGAIGRKLHLAAGQSATVTFILAWNFPNLNIKGMVGGGGRHYALKFPSALDVAQYLTTNLEALAGQTYLWRDTWYDSTLPYWFLDITHINVCTLATATAYRLASGRFYGNEGVGCCAGTCTHVWQYEQAMGRLFPELDIRLREIADFNPGVGFNPDGGIGMRGEFSRTVAVDGHAGCILRAYRDHQMSPDREFLLRNWDSIKKAVQYSIRQDGNGDGLLEGPQHNTLDAAWYGKIPWLSSLYLASLHAAEAMAIEMDDPGFAAQCRTIYTAGRANFIKELWKPEYGYFIQVADPAHKNKVGAYDGCEISQVFGQHWAFQVGLGRVLPAEQTKAALASLYKFNFTPDVGPYRQVHTSGRWYAMPGEGGVIGCTWPFGEETRVRTDFDYYFNECQNGYEFQPAAHMIWEGLVFEGLVIGRSLFDRYHARKRNPWNEVECGDHYARSMASYGLFTAACGFEYHGPKGYLAFAPRLSAEDFRAAFTSAEGWGAFSQKVTAEQQTAALEIKWGRLRLKTLALAAKAAPAAVQAQVNGKPVPVASRFQDGRVVVTFDPDLQLGPNQQLHLVFNGAA